MDERSSPATAPSYRAKKDCHSSMGGAWLWIAVFIVVFIIAMIVFLIWNPVSLQNTDAAGIPNGEVSWGKAALASLVVAIIAIIFGLIVVWLACGRAY